MLLSHRLADFAANPVAQTGSSGVIATSNGTTSTYTAGGLTYRLHRFTAGTKSFTVTQAGEIDILLVGAGGFGQNANGGGGVYESLNYSVSTGTYSLSVGAVSPNQFSASGNTTGFGTTAYAGGNGPFGGGISSFRNSNTGATGGGGAGGAAGQAAGTGKYNGGSGGNGPNPLFTASGGGGGAGGQGTNGEYNGLGGNGGAGIASSITGTTEYYGAGQQGGGSSGFGTNPTGYGNPGSGGYDGTIIIRYQIA